MTEEMPKAPEQPVPEQEKVQLMPDDEAQKAYIEGNKERFNEWVNQEQGRVEAYKGNGTYAKLFLEQKLARIQFAAGEVSDALERLREAALLASDEADRLEVPTSGDPDAEKERVRQYYQMVDFVDAAQQLAREFEASE